MTSLRIDPRGPPCASEPQSCHNDNLINAHVSSASLLEVCTTCLRLSDCHSLSLIEADNNAKEVSACIGGGPLAPVKLVDDTFVNANTGDVVELHGMSWVGA